MFTKQPTTVQEHGGGRLPFSQIGSKGRIYLRHDQKSDIYRKVSKSRVTIYAPQWVQEALHILKPKLSGASFHILGQQGQILDELILKNDISLTDLYKITRNEPLNVTGIIPFDYYKPEILDREVILSLKDLIRQCVTVGTDKTTAYGGYNCRRFYQRVKVYICDLSGLQFQTPSNTGRLVLIGNEKTPLPRGKLDDFIYRRIVGEDKKTYREVGNNPSTRYVHYTSYSRYGDVFFDTYAYRKLVAKDVILCGLALETLATQKGLSRSKSPQSSKTHKQLIQTEMGTESLGSQHIPPTTSRSTLNSKTNNTIQNNASSSNSNQTPNVNIAHCSQMTNQIYGDLLNFKFLSYGSGFFADKFSDTIHTNILPAVIDGLETLFKRHRPKHIRVVEFPFYTLTSSAQTRLERLKKKYGVDYKFSKDDALKETVKGLVTATTNCSDPHAATGNEMGFSSVDAAIASNLKSKGNIFSPLLNPKITSTFVHI